MRRLLRWGLRSVAVIVALIVLLAVALALILNSESGTRWALARIDAALAGELIVTEFKGTFWQGLQLSSLTYRDQERELHATAVELRIDWSTVTTGELALDEVRAATLLIRSLAAPMPEAKLLTLAMAPIPIDIAITSGNIGELTLAGSGEPQHFTDVVVSAARINGNTIRARSIALTTLGIDMTAAKLRLTLAGEAPAAAQISWSFADGVWAGQGVAHGSLTLLEFEQSVTGPYPFMAEGTAQILQQTEPVFAATVRWNEWLLSGYRLLDGAALLQGTTGSYAAEYTATVIMPDAQELLVAGSASGNLRQFDMFAAQVDSRFGHAALAGTLSWLPSFAAAADVHASNIDPRNFVQSLDGQLEGDAHVTVNADGNVSLTGLAVSGVLNGAPIRAQGDINLAPERIECVACALAVGENKLRIDGRTSAGELALSVFVDAPDLRQLWPDIAGTARGEGELLGPVQHPQFTGVLTAEQFVFGDWAAQSISIDSRDSTLTAMNIRADIAELRNGDSDYGTFSASGAGQPTDLRLDIEWLVRGLQVNAVGTLQTAGTDLTGSIEQATIIEPQTGAWQLQDAFAFRLADNALSIGPHLWSGDSGDLRVSTFGVTGEQIEIVASVDRLPLQLADWLLPTGFHLQGEATASIDVARRADVWSGSLEWRQANTMLRITEGNEQSTDVRVPRAELQAGFRDGGLVAKAWLAIEPGVSSELDLQLSSLDADALLNAELRLQGDDWSWISAVVPEIDGFRGSITASVKANGPLTTPALSGDVTWRDGRLLLPALNVPLDDISLTISGAPQGTATVTGSAKAGSGTLAVNGTINKLMQTARSITLNVTGKAAEIINWPEYHLWGSPDITIVGDALGWRVGGNLTVPRADIEIREIPVEAVAISDDVVVLGEEDIRVTATRVSGAVRLRLGDQVRIKALGLDSGLSGELLVHRQQDRAMSAEGRITLVNGSFAAQGQKLSIQKGELTFTGPLDDPIVDVRAVRIIDTLDGTVTAGIHLHGRAQNLTSTVFSEPTMNDVDALSYLVIGRPLNQATEAEGGQLSGAAVSLGLRQATRLTEQIGQTLGLDQLSLSGDGGDTTALIAGKKINSRLYARYAYGVFSRLGTLLLRYKLSRRLTLEAGAGESQSIDILYSVETQ